MPKLILDFLIMVILTNAILTTWLTVNFLRVRKQVGKQSRQLALLKRRVKKHGI